MSAKAVSPRLGRGLAALLGDAPAQAPAPAALPSAGISSVPVEQLEPSPFQPRKTMAADALDDLVESMRNQGVLQPLLARAHPSKKDTYQIIAGERRWRAAQKAGLHVVPVLIRKLSDEEAMSAALVENLQRQDLNAIEEAEGYQRLAEDFGNTQDAIATAVGKSRSHVANTLRLLNLPASIRDEVRKGTLTAGHARAILGRPDAEQLAQTIITRGLSVRQAEALAAPQPTKDQQKPSAKPKDTETAALEQDLTEQLGLKVEITFDGKAGSVRIKYQTLDQLDSLIARLQKN